MPLGPSAIAPPHPSYVGYSALPAPEPLPGNATATATLDVLDVQTTSGRRRSIALVSRRDGAAAIDLSSGEVVLACVAPRGRTFTATCLVPSGAACLRHPRAQTSLVVPATLDARTAARQAKCHELRDRVLVVTGDTESTVAVWRQQPGAIRTNAVTTATWSRIQGDGSDAILQIVLTAATPKSAPWSNPVAAPAPPPPVPLSASPVGAATSSSSTTPQKGLPAVASAAGGTSSTSGSGKAHGGGSGNGSGKLVHTMWAVLASGGLMELELALEGVASASLTVGRRVPCERMLSVPIFLARAAVVCGTGADGQVMLFGTARGTGAPAALSSSSGALTSSISVGFGDPTGGAGGAGANASMTMMTNPPATTPMLRVWHIADAVTAHPTVREVLGVAGADGPMSSQFDEPVVDAVPVGALMAPSLVLVLFAHAVHLYDIDVRCAVCAPLCRSSALVRRTSSEQQQHRGGLNAIGNEDGPSFTRLWPGRAVAALDAPSSTSGASFYTLEHDGHLTAWHVAWDDLVGGSGHNGRNALRAAPPVSRSAELGELVQCVQHPSRPERFFVLRPDDSVVGWTYCAVRQLWCADRVVHLAVAPTVALQSVAQAVDGVVQPGAALCTVATDTRQQRHTLQIADAAFGRVSASLSLRGAVRIEAVEACPEHGLVWIAAASRATANRKATAHGAVFAFDAESHAARAPLMRYDGAKNRIVALRYNSACGQLAVVVAPMPSTVSSSGAPVDPAVAPGQPLPVGSLRLWAAESRHLLTLPPARSTAGAGEGGIGGRARSGERVLDARWVPVPAMGAAQGLLVLHDDGEVCLYDCVDPHSIRPIGSLRAWTTPWHHPVATNVIAVDNHCAVYMAWGRGAAGMQRLILGVAAGEAARVLGSSSADVSIRPPAPVVRALVRGGAVTSTGGQKASWLAAQTSDGQLAFWTTTSGTARYSYSSDVGITRLAWLPPCTGGLAVIVRRGGGTQLLVDPDVAQTQQPPALLPPAAASTPSKETAGTGSPPSPSCSRWSQFIDPCERRLFRAALHTALDLVSRRASSSSSPSDRQAFPSVKPTTDITSLAALPSTAWLGCLSAESLRRNAASLCALRLRGLRALEAVGRAPAALRLAVAHGMVRTGSSSDAANVAADVEHDDSDFGSCAALAIALASIGGREVPPSVAVMARRVAAKHTFAGRVDDAVDLLCCVDATEEAVEALLAAGRHLDALLVAACRVAEADRVAAAGGSADDAGAGVHGSAWSPPSEQAQRVLAASMALRAARCAVAERAERAGDVAAAAACLLAAGEVLAAIVLLRNHRAHAAARAVAEAVVTRVGPDTPLAKLSPCVHSFARTLLQRSRPFQVLDGRSCGELIEGVTDS